MNTKIERAVRMGLQLAAGKPMDEAVATMLECLELVIDVGATPAPAPLANPDPPRNPPRKAAISESAPPRLPLADLAPIDGSEAPTEKPRVRVYWTPEDLTNKIISETPSEMEIQVNDTGDKIKIFRKISQQGGAAPGVQLGYGPQVPDPAVPFPKTSFWVTTEEVDLESAVADMRKAAASMYKMRAPVQTKPMVAKPLRFNVGAEVE
jgi:hypothetical protein